MLPTRLVRRPLSLLLIGALVFLISASAQAQTPDVEEFKGQEPLGALIERATTIEMLRVAKMDAQGILFSRAGALKGAAPSGQVLCKLDDAAPGARSLRAWARPGQLAICFERNGQAITCVGNAWYRGGLEEPLKDSRLASIEELYSQTYVGPVEVLHSAVKAVLAGREVVVTACAGDLESDNCPIRRDWLHGRKNLVCRVRASRNLTDPIPNWLSDASSEFVGWGVGGREIIPQLEAKLASRNPEVRAGAILDLTDLGTLARPALPAIRNALHDQDAFVRLYATEAVARLNPNQLLRLRSVREALEAADPDLRLAAIDVAARLQQRSSPLVPPLVLALTDREREIRTAAAYALGIICPDAKPTGWHREEVAAALGACLLDRDEQSGLATRAARSLLLFGADAWPALPELNELLHSDRSGMASALAAQIISRLEPAPVILLADALRDPNCSARSVILWEMERLGPQARLALPAVTAASAAGPPGLMVSAARAVKAIAGRRGVHRVSWNVKKEIDSLSEMVDGITLAITLRDLQECGVPLHGAIPTLSRLAQDRKALLAPAAIECLGRIGAANEAPLLRRLLASRRARTRAAAAGALWRLGKDREAAAVLLPVAIAGEDDQARDAALRTLQDLGPTAGSAVPVLRRALRDRSDRWRTEVAHALWTVAPGTNAATARQARHEALAALVGELGAGADRTYAAATVLQQLGPAAVPAVPALIRALRDKDGTIRDAAAVALGQIGPAARAAVPALRALLKDRTATHTAVPALRVLGLEGTANLGITTAIALARIDPGCDEALRVLINNLPAHPEYSPVPSEICEALAQAGPRARAAVPTLRRLAGSPIDEVYAAASRALKAIDPEAARDVWSIRGLLHDPRRPVTEPSQAQLEQLWRQAADADPGKAARAAWKLMLSPRAALPFLRTRVRPIARVESGRLAKLIAELDDKRFAVRQRAATELAQAGEQAEGALRQALVAQPSFVLRREFGRLLEDLDPLRSPTRRRAVYLVHLLEQVDVACADELLEALGRGVPEAALTQEARAALKRKVR